MRELSGKVALITGGGRGIGRSVAVTLAQRGARVAVLSRTDVQVRQTAEAITDAGGQARAYACDVSDRQALEGTFSAIRDQLGPVDILVNNAAIIGPLCLTSEADFQEWTRVIEVNLIGSFYATRLALPGMLERGWGRIINISSGAAVGTGFPRGSAYSVSKAGLDMLTRAVASEIAGSGVVSVGIYPGVVDTEMQAQIRATPVERLGKETSERFHGYYETGQLLDPALPAALAGALCGPDGVDYNGSLMRVTDEIAQPLIARFQGQA